MPSTTTRDPSTDGTVDQAAAAEPVPAAELTGHGEGPPAVIKDSRASFALFASFIAVLLSLAALIAVAFKLDDQQGSAGATQAAAPPAGGAPSAQPTPQGSDGGTLNLNMGDYSFSPPNASAAAGKVKIAAINDGKLPHEMVLARTNVDPSQLPTTSDGSVDEEKLSSPGEIPDVAAGATKQATINLKPGNYAMFCNLPGHYAAGMYGTLTVK